jgi:hypothetical protein
MRRKTRKHNFKSGKIKWNKTFRINKNNSKPNSKHTKKQHGSAPLDKNGKLNFERKKEVIQIKYL